MSSFVVDSHVHVLPDVLARFRETSVGMPVSLLRRRARTWLGPVSAGIHKAQTLFRHFPEPMRWAIDQMAGIAPLPVLLIESTAEDLIESMDDAGISSALVIAHAPVISNDFVVELSQADSRFLPVVNLTPGTARPGEALRRYAKEGVRALKLHPAADGEGVDSPRFKALLKVADDLGLPVILHTGCIHTNILYKDPAQGHAQRFAPWFEKYKSVRFVLAHMNFHAPHVALDLAEEYPNIFVETSWQPTEMISEAVRRIGSERVMFGTDWPFVGHNQAVGVGRIRDCVDSGFIDAEAANRILGANAAKLFGISSPAVEDDAT